MNRRTFMLTASAIPFAGLIACATSAKGSSAVTNSILLADLAPGVVVLLTLVADHVQRRPERMIAAVHRDTMTPVYIPAYRAHLPEYQQFVLLPDDIHERWTVAVKTGHLAV